jgi:hypothetical protein
MFRVTQQQVDPDLATLEASSWTDIMTLPEAAVTAFSTLDDGCCVTRNM